VTCELAFPEEFLFGSATSATQIEGGCTTSDWHTFCRQPGRTRNGDTPDVACDSWNRWPEDIALQRTLGLRAYRMSIEWARLEPRPDEISTAAFETYRRILEALTEAGIEPVVTLHHFSLPHWLSQRGGILADEFPDRLGRFASHVADRLGDACRLWITINEPNVLAAQAYLLGVWPPASKSPLAALRCLYRLLEGHVAAYRALKDKRGDSARVGVAHHLRAAEALRPSSRSDRIAARLLDRLFNEGFALALCERHMFGAADALLSRGRRSSVEESRGTHDFFGINYYTRDVVRFAPTHASELFLHRSTPPEAEVSDLGWEVYPQGLGRLVRTWSQRSGLPVYVTENGIADAADTKRSSFLTRHLAEVARAIGDGIDVRGYFHWSLLDNFEWAEGYGPRFGLVEVDYASQARRIRSSGHLYGQIALERRLPRE
jgi:beta-glucosidase